MKRYIEMLETDRMDDDKIENKYHIQSVDRALQILTCFSLAKPDLSLIELCEMTGLPKPTVFRLLSTLEANHFVGRSPDKQKYSVGIRLFELGNIYITNLSIERIVSPYMQEITRKFNIDSNLAILDGGQVVYIASINSGGPFRYASIVGYRHYIHCSALGKALVMDLPEDKILDLLLEKGMPALSPNTITQPEKFIENIAQTRPHGYMVDDQEGAIGIYCLAVPIWNRSGHVIAALSVSGPSPMYTDSLKEEIIQMLKDSADDARKEL